MGSNERPQYPCEALGSELREHWREIIDTAFFASLGKEEGEPIRVQIVYHQDGLGQLNKVRDQESIADGTMPRAAWQVIPFATKSGVTEFNVENLRKIAPASDLPRSYVVLGTRDSKLVIHGIAHRLEHTYFRPDGEDDILFVQAPKPGHMTLTHQGHSCYYEDGRWTRRIGLETLLFDEESIVRAALKRLCRQLIDSLPSGFGSGTDTVVQVVRTLVARMAVMKHGGLIAMTNDTVTSVGKYQILPNSRTILSARIEKHAKARREHFKLLFRDSTDAEEGRDLAVAGGDDRIENAFLESLVAGIAQLTAVDNALVFGKDLALICAGFPIKTSEPPDIWEASNSKGEKGRQYHIGQHGSRHRAAAVFAHQASGNVAFLASQDGVLRCFHRPFDQDIVLIWQLRHD